MKKLIILIVFVSSLAACNDSSEGSTTQDSLNMPIDNARNHMPSGADSNHMMGDSAHMMGDSGHMMHDSSMRQ